RTRPYDPDAPPGAGTAPSNERTAPASLLHSPQPTSSTAPHAASLRGTEVGGRLQTDADGNLLISDQLRHLFDYYLSTTGEQNHAQIVAQVQALIRDSLDDPARSQALDLFQRYLDYQRALVALEQDFPAAADIDSLWARQDAVERLR